MTAQSAFGVLIRDPNRSNKATALPQPRLGSRDPKTRVSRLFHDPLDSVKAKAATRGTSTRAFLL